MILCSGTFDGLHIGHVRYLEAAAKERRDGERFVVAVAPDAYVVWNKRRQPRWRVSQRMGVIQALAVVDQTVVHSINGTADVIERMKPRLFIKGKDWDGHLPDDILKACHDAGTSILFVDSQVNRHTSDVR